VGQVASAGAEDLLRGTLQRIQARTGYALLRREGVPVALGLGVLERDWLGIFSMATHPEFRRQGAATAILHALATWGQQCGAARAYLQVMEGNTAAVAAYARAGLDTLYQYHYREGAVIER
jgi:GNAT superfamily N-acetyltransferase